MVYLCSFLFCGIICLIGQIILDNTKLTPGHITSLFVILGSILDINNIYDMILNKVGSGASVPITSFGHLLTHAAMDGYKESGLLGLCTNMFTKTSAGIACAIFFAFVFSLVFKPRD